MGLRGNATAMAVPMVMASVTSAATAHPLFNGHARGVGVELHQYDLRPRSREIALRWIWLVPPEMVATIDSR